MISLALDCRVALRTGSEEGVSGDIARDIFEELREYKLYCESSEAQVIIRYLPTRKMRRGDALFIAVENIFT
jgi:hypothetical protein